jgi:hypothetical protein
MKGTTMLSNTTVEGLRQYPYRIHSVYELA